MCTGEVLTQCCAPLTGAAGTSAEASAAGGAATAPSTYGGTAGTTGSAYGGTAGTSGSAYGGGSNDASGSSDSGNSYGAAGRRLSSGWHSGYGGVQKKAATPVQVVAAPVKVAPAKAVPLKAELTCEVRGGWALRSGCAGFWRCA